jgi:CDP-paratose 2-epimerase
MAEEDRGWTTENGPGGAGDGKQAVDALHLPVLGLTEHFRRLSRDGSNGTLDCGFTAAPSIRHVVTQDPDPGLQSAVRNRNGPVLITGGAGFIGSNLAERLLDVGRPVMILDNLSRAGAEHNVRYLCDTYGDLLEVHLGDVRNRDFVEELVARCKSVFHFAAQVAVTASLVDPADDFESNLCGTLNVLEAVRKQDAPPPLLFTSTHKVYGDLRDVELIPVGRRHVPRDHATRTCGINESRPLDSHGPYSCSKGAADQYVLDYARMYGLPGVVFRMSCIYGRRQRGTQDQGWVAHFALQMLRDGPLTLYGDGRQVRDILYIDDLLDAMLLAMKDIQVVAGKAFNIGGGPDNAVSLLEVIGQLSELSGVEPQIRYGPRRTGDQPYYVSDIRRFSKATGWTPQVSAARGVPRLYHWLLENVEPGVLEQKE